MRAAPLPDAREAPPPPVIQKGHRRYRFAAHRRAARSHRYRHGAEISEFNRRVYAIARAIPNDLTLTYGEIAERLGDKALARAVGQAMGENPTPIIMPCHRVLAANGKTGGFSAPGGVITKLRLLTIEGAEPGGPTLFDRLPLEARPR